MVYLHIEVWFTSVCVCMCVGVVCVWVVFPVCSETRFELHSLTLVVLMIFTTVAFELVGDDYSGGGVRLWHFPLLVSALVVWTYVLYAMFGIEIFLMWHSQAFRV